MNYGKLTKAELLSKLQEKDEYIQKQELMYKKQGQQLTSTEQDRDQLRREVKDFAEAKQQLQNTKQALKKLQDAPSSNIESVLEARIKQQDQTIVSLTQHINSLLGVAGDYVKISEGSLNMFNNAIKNIVTEIQNTKG